RAGEVDRDDALEGLVRQLVGRGVAVEDARGVHHDRQRAEPAHRRGDRTVDVGPAARVAGDRERPAASPLDRLDRLLRALRLHVEDGDGRAAGGEGDGDRAADPRAATGAEGAAGDEARRSTNSTTAAAAASGASCRSMWPPAKSRT